MHDESYFKIEDYLQKESSTDECVCDKAILPIEHNKCNNKTGIADIKISQPTPLRVFTDSEIARLKQFGITVPREVWTQTELDAINKKCNTMLKVVTGRHSRRFQDKLRRKNLA